VEKERERREKAERSQTKSGDPGQLENVSSIKVSTERKENEIADRKKGGNRRIVKNLPQMNPVSDQKMEMK